MHLHDTGDKTAKVRPLFDHSNTWYLQYWPAEEDLDIDESMVTYYGIAHQKFGAWMHG